MVRPVFPFALVRTIDSVTFVHCVLQLSMVPMSGGHPST